MRALTVIETHRDFVCCRVGGGASGEVCIAPKKIEGLKGLPALNDFVYEYDDGSYHMRPPKVEELQNVVQTSS